MGETILVTGATGTVGSEVVKQLLSAKVERGYEDMIVKVVHVQLLTIHLAT